MFAEINHILFNDLVSYEAKIIAIFGKFNERLQDIYMLMNQVQTLTAKVNTLCTTLPIVAGRGTSWRVEVFADPEEYNGSKAKFEEWWSKIKAWLMVNSSTITPGSYEVVVAILSQLKESKTAVFAHIHLQQECAYDWLTLVDEVEGLFHSMNQQDWAKEQHKKYYQDTSPTNDFIIKWEAMYQQAGIDDLHAVDLLEKNVHGSIITQIFREGKWNPAYLAEIHTIGMAQESLDFIRGWTNQWALAQHSKCDPNTMDIGATNSKACYNCGKEGHFTKNCPKPINTCPQCKWLGGNHKKGHKKGGQHTREVHTSWEDDKSILSDNEHEVCKALKRKRKQKRL